MGSGECGMGNVGTLTPALSQREREFSFVVIVGVDEWVGIVGALFFALGRARGAAVGGELVELGFQRLFDVAGDLSAQAGVADGAKNRVVDLTQRGFEV